MQAIGRGLFQLMGWNIDYRLPDDPKMVLIFAPHTSNSDAFHALPAASQVGPCSPVTPRPPGQPVRVEKRRTGHARWTLFSSLTPTLSPPLIAVAATR